MTIQTTTSVPLVHSGVMTTQTRVVAPTGIHQVTAQGPIPVLSMKSELAKLPGYVYHWLAVTNGVKFTEAKDAVTDILPNKKGVRAGGRYDNWDVTPGTYDKETNQVILALNGRYKGNENSFNMTLHETGHAAERWCNGKDLIINARHADLYYMDEYYRQAYPLGQTEVFSEGFAMFYGKTSDNGKEMARRFRVFPGLESDF